MSLKVRQTDKMKAVHTVPGFYDRTDLQKAFQHIATYRCIQGVF